MSCIAKKTKCRLRTERCPLPEVAADAHVCVRELSASELVHLQAGHGDKAQGFEFCCEVLAKVLCDDGGTNLYDSAQDVRDNLELPLHVYDRLLKAALQVSQIPSSDEEKKLNARPNLPAPSLPALGVRPSRLSAGTIERTAIAGLAAVSRPMRLGD